MLLELKNVALKLANDSILKKVNLKLKPGNIYLLMGYSGSGKTSLLRILNNLYSPTEGQFLIDNRNYCEYSPYYIRNKILLSFQKSFFFDDTVENNLKKTLKIKKRSYEVKTIVKYMKYLGLPDSYLNKSINTLSVGEQQRINFIRSILFDPEVFLFDEPTSALDPKLKKRIYKWMSQISKQGKTIVLVTHNLLKSTQIADYIIFLDNKTIFFNNTPDIFLNNQSKIIREFREGEDG